MEDMLFFVLKGGRMSSLPEHPGADPRDAHFEFRSHRKGDSYLFELAFTPNPRLVPIVRRFVSDFYGEVFADPEIISRLALATHELMENAVRHNSGDEARLMVELRDLPGAKHISVRIGNPSFPENIAKVGRLLEAMDRAPDLFQFYLELMGQTAREPEGSGLGLTRIRAEGEMQLSHTVQGQWVEITASTTCPARAS
jgi:anti-sigma regulatory factor (Ser/Thr protein kinase)